MYVPILYVLRENDGTLPKHLTRWWRARGGDLIKNAEKGFILLSDTASYTDSDAVSDTVFVPATTEIL